MKLFSRPEAIWLAIFATATATATSPPTFKVCPAVPNNHPGPGQHSVCGASGIPHGDWLVRESFGMYNPPDHCEKTCRDMCLHSSECKSFSFTEADNVCHFFKSDISYGGVLERKSPSKTTAIYWAVGCFTVPKSCHKSTTVAYLPTSSTSSPKKSSTSIKKYPSTSPKKSSTTSPKKSSSTSSSSKYSVSPTKSSSSTPKSGSTSVSSTSTSNRSTSSSGSTSTSSTSTPSTSTSSSDSSTSSVSTTSSESSTSSDSSSSSTSTSTTSTSTSTSISISVGQDFTETYTFAEYTLPIFTTGPLSTQGPATTDVPSLPSPTPVCFIDPSNQGSTFNVLSPSMVPLIPKNGAITVLQAGDLPADYATNGYTYPIWYFQSNPQSSNNAYDLLVTDTSGNLLYVGLHTETGGAVTTDASSVSGTIITTIFEISCVGQLTIVLDGSTYVWSVALNGINTAMAEGVQVTANTMLALSVSATPTSTTPDNSRRRKRTINYEGGEAPRCPNNPPGLIAVAATGARPRESNGCGSGATAKYIPQLTFTGCCDAHDFCYDNCVDGYFESCNNDFESCMYSSCSSISAFYHPIDRLTCYAAAKFYYEVVAGYLGEVAFYEANYYDPQVAATKGDEATGRCVCECSSPDSYCNGQCLNFQTDSSNCGGCGIKCTGSSLCSNGQCVCPYNTQTDSNNCGACGIVCPSWTSCQSGTCNCASPLTTCGNLCVDFNNHPRHCGSCSNVCASGYCTEGQCVTPPAEICNPGDAITNGGFDDDDADTDWLFNPNDGESGAGYDGGSNSYPNSVALDVRGSAVTLAQNIAVCPGARYALTFEIRNVDISSNNCYWVAWVAGQQLGSGSISNTRATTFESVGPIYMDALPGGTGTGTPGSADYTTYQYDSASLRAYTQLAIIATCDSSSPAIIRVDTISFYQG